MGTVLIILEEVGKIEWNMFEWNVCTAHERNYFDLVDLIILSLNSLTAKDFATLACLT